MDTQTIQEKWHCHGNSRTTQKGKGNEAILWPHQANKRIALFNHKGGVSKTTTTFHLGWMLAKKGHRVVLVDADPQCSLSGLVLGYQGQDQFEDFYKKHPERNIRAGLVAAFEAQPREIKAIDCEPVNGNPNLFLLPGHIRLPKWEVSLGMAQELFIMQTRTPIRTACQAINHCQPAGS